MAPGRARVVLADHQVVFRQGLRNHIVNGGFEVVCEAADGDTLEHCMIESEPDIVILDRYLPGIDALAYCQMLNALQPQLQILLLVAYEHEAQALQTNAFLAGAAGCLSKDLAPSVYLSALYQLSVGQLLFHPEVMRRAARAQGRGTLPQLANLTDREQEILRLVAEGLGNRDIAQQLGISYHTAMKHVSNIITKLNVSNRMEAGLLWLRSGEQTPRDGGKNKKGPE